jgi:hypothetical protein
MTPLEIQIDTMVNDPLRPNLSSRLTQQDLVNKGLLAIGMAPMGITKAKTAYELAHDVASKNAEKMLGLPKGNTYIDRAKALGYETPLFHETSAENLDKLKGFNVKNAVAAATDEQTPYAVFTKRKGDSIGLAREGEVQMPLLAREGKQAVYRDRDALQNHLLYDEKSANAIREAQYYDKIEMKNKFDQAMKNSDKFEQQGNRRLSDKYMDNMNSLLDEWKKGNIERAAKSKDSITDFFKNEGYDSVRLYNDAGSGGRNVDTTMILNPMNLRSRFAAFDPARINESDLLAGLAPYLGIGGLLSLGLLTPEQAQAGEQF